MAESEVDAKRYRLLRDYLLSNGFVVHQTVPLGDAPFVLDADFYGHTFDDAVDSLERLGTKQANGRGAVYEMPKRQND